MIICDLDGLVGGECISMCGVGLSFTKMDPFQFITINPNYANKITKSSTSLPSTHSPFTKTIKTPTTTSTPKSTPL